LTKIVFLIATILVSCSALTAQTNVIDNKGTRRSVDTSKWLLSGSNISSKNTGNVGIGISNPSSKLDVNGSLRVRNSSVKIDSLQGGNLSDSVVVWRRGDSVLRKLSSASLRTIASNGVSNGANGDSVILGGTLNRATIITQSAAKDSLTFATGGNKLKITGLTSGSSSDSLVVIDPSNGNLKRINIRRITMPSVITVSTTTYTLSESDHGVILDFTNAAAIALTVPNSLPIGFQASITQANTGQITISGSGGMVVNNRWNGNRTSGRWAKAGIEVRAANSAVLSGDVQ
jgi:hypothetical protein